MNDEAAGRGGSGGGRRSGPGPEEDLGNAAEVLRQIRAALEGADDRLQSMTDAAVARAEDGAAAARNGPLTRPPGKCTANWSWLLAR